jgi:hypothetical protein
MRMSPNGVNLLTHSGSAATAFLSAVFSAGFSGFSTVLVGSPARSASAVGVGAGFR